MYQDFYMVQWASPHDAVDYKSYENGSESLKGATWEPDECLPDDLDPLRLQVKRTWMEKQRDRELLLEKDRREREQREISRVAGDDAARHKRTLEEFQEAGLPKAARTIEDIMNPSIRHGVLHLPTSTDDKEIKAGWPKNDADFPAGYGAADPPGCCKPECDCMEDWHLGRAGVDSKKPWIDVPDRAKFVDTSLQGFINLQGLVTRRGQVSGNHYLEAVHTNYQRADFNDVSHAADLSRVFLAAIREAAQAIPLGAFLGEDPDGKGIFREMVPAFCGAANVQALMPVQFLPTSVPHWLRISIDSGEAWLNGEEIPVYQKGHKVRVLLTMGNFNAPSETMEAFIDPHDVSNGGQVMTHRTAQLVKGISTLKPTGLRQVLEQMLAEVFDFQLAMPLEAPIACWVHSVVDAALALRAASVGCIVPRDTGN